jgi:hypothetical protein
MLTPINEMHTETPVTLAEQMSLRFTAEQKEFLQAQVAKLRDNPATSSLRFTEADLIRTLIDQARRADHDIIQVGASA